jgi:hypothetical protein
MNRTEWVAELAVPVAEDRGHIQGGPDAVVTLVQYGGYECPYSGKAYPIVKEVQDKKRHYLRSAWVRAVGPGSKDFWVFTQMRSDSESLNRTVEDSLYRHHRAHSDGWARQQVDMLGLAGLINALTRERMRRQVLYQAA